MPKENGNGNGNSQGKPDKVDVIMVYDGKPDQAEKRSRKRLSAARPSAKFKNFNMRVISVSENALKHLGKGKGVRFVAKDAPIESFLGSGPPDGRATARSARTRSRWIRPSVSRYWTRAWRTHSDLNVASRLNCTASAVTPSGTFADFFGSPSYSNNDGSNSFSGAWVEYDVAGAGPSSGNVTVSGGELLLNDQPDTGTQPSAARSMDLSQAVSATFSFDFRTGSGVDANSDRIAVDISDDGGSNYTSLEILETYGGGASGSRSYDITPYMSNNTMIRFRVTDLLRCIR